MKFEKIDKLRLDHQVIEDTINIEGFRDSQLFEANINVICITNDKGFWDCGFEYGNEKVKDIETINFLGKNENNITLHKYDDRQRINNDPRKDLKCIVGMKGREKTMLCGSIEDFGYFILPSLKFTLEEGD